MKEPQDRCVKIFLESLKSEVTKTNYMRALGYFRDFAKIENFSELLEMDSKKLSELIEDYIIDRKRTNSPNALGVYYFPIQSFLEMNDVLLNFKKFKRMFPAKVKTAPERGWTTEEIRIMLSVCSNLRQRAVIHFENASGGRIEIFDIEYGKIRESLEDRLERLHEKREELLESKEYSNQEIINLEKLIHQVDIDRWKLLADNDVVLSVRRIKDARSHQERNPEICTRNSR